MKGTLARWTNPRYSQTERRSRGSRPECGDRTLCWCTANAFPIEQVNMARLDVSTVACIPYAAEACKRRA